MPSSDFTPLFTNTADESSFEEGSDGGVFFDSHNTSAQNTPQNTPKKTYLNNNQVIPHATPHATRQERAEQEIMRRVPPHSVEAEQGVIGAIFLNKEVMHVLVDTITPDDFYLPAHRVLFKAFIELYRDSKPLDMTSVHIYLEAHQLLEQAGGAVYLADIAEAYVSAETAKHYASIVRDRSMQRSLIEACADIIGNCFDASREINDLLADSEKSVFAISERSSGKNFQSIGQLTKTIFEEATLRTDQRSSVTGIPTDYTRLDNLTAGLQPSDLIILAARPAMGKTAFALNIAMRTAIHHNTAVAVFSLEMSASSLAERMLSLWSKVELSRLRRGFLDDDDWQKLHSAANALDKAPIFIDDTAELNTLTLRARCRRLKAEHGLGFVIVDYLQLMRSSRNESRELEISDISRNLKALAKELKIPVLALSQLNRKVEERSDKRPMLSDLRESGAIEQDADMIMFIHREDAYNKTKDKPMTNIAEIILGKHRNGPTGTVELAYLPQYTAFENLDY